MPSTLNSQLATPQPSTAVAIPAKSRRWLTRIAWLLIFGCALLLVCYTFRVPLLTGLAEAWVVNEPVTKADAIVVLGGNPEIRPFAAAKLFHDGVAPQILYMNIQLDPAEELGVTLPESESTRRILSSNGVPEMSMTMVGDGVSSTFDESRAVRAWLEKAGAKSILIPTDLFHTRRVRWIFNKELRGTKVEVHVMAITPHRYKTSDWWQHEEGLIAFQNEIIKSLYYRLKY